MSLHIVDPENSAQSLNDLDIVYPSIAQYTSVNNIEEMSKKQKLIGVFPNLINFHKMHSLIPSTLLQVWKYGSTLDITSESSANKNWLYRR